MKPVPQHRPINMHLQHWSLLQLSHTNSWGETNLFFYTLAGSCEGNGFQVLLKTQMQPKMDKMEELFAASKNARNSWDIRKQNFETQGKAKLKTMETESPKNLMISMSQTANTGRRHSSVTRLGRKCSIWQHFWFGKILPMFLAGCKLEEYLQKDMCVCVCACMCHPWVYMHTHFPRGKHTFSN